MSRVAMCEVRSKEKKAKNKPPKKKYNDHQHKKMNYDKPHLMSNEKRSPSNGHNGQLVHWWLLMHSGSSNVE